MVVPAKCSAAEMWSGSSSWRALQQVAMAIDDTPVTGVPNAWVAMDGAASRNLRAIPARWGALGGTRGGLDSQIREASHLLPADERAWAPGCRMARSARRPGSSFRTLPLHVGLRVAHLHECALLPLVRASLPVLRQLRVPTKSRARKQSCTPSRGQDLNRMS